MIFIIITIIGIFFAIIIMTIIDFIIIWLYFL
jgi:hypothetical protein